MPVYERFCGRDESGAPTALATIPGHLFQALLGEVARGRLTGAQARTILEERMGDTLTGSEATELSTLLASISGSATTRLARAKEIDDVLTLAQLRVTGYDRASLLTTRLA